MDVFVRSALKKSRLRGVHADLFECGHDRRAFLRRNDPNLLQRARERLGAAAVSIQQSLIEMERAGKSFENLRRSGLESPAPEFHVAASCGFVLVFICVYLRLFAAIALTRIGSPTRLMNPCASF